MRARGLALVILALSASPVAAQGFLESAGGGWSVIGLPSSCMALNRPPAEFNFAPFNGLVFHQRKDENLPRIQALFWPGAFAEGQAVVLRLKPAGRKAVELEAKAQSTYHIVTNDMAPEDLLETLTNVETVEIAASGVSHSLLFETGALETVADLMGKCISQ
jgi:hypothetical protein